MTKKSVLESKPLQTKRLEDGKRQLLRDLVVSVDDETIRIPIGFETDFSSYPRVILILLITGLVLWIDYDLDVTYEPLIILFLLLIPRFSRVDVAGVVHDYLYYTGSHSKWAADKIWYQIAITGSHRASKLQAIPSWFFGLVMFGYFAWWKCRKNDNKN